MRIALALLSSLQASPVSTPAVPYDCSWIYHSPMGVQERFEGVYFAFIDDNGFYACSSAKTCKDWIGRESEEIAFTDRAGAQFQRRAEGLYGVFKIAFQGRRGKIANRPGCEPNRWNLELRPSEYIQIEKVLSVRPLKDIRP